MERQERIRLFRDGWNAYAEMVQLNVRMQDSESGLAFAERARARTLLESTMGAGTRPAPVRSIARILQADTAVVFYVVQPDALWLWIITREGIRFFERPVPLRGLQFRIARVERLLQHRLSRRASAAAEGLSETLRSLHRDLLAPIADVLASTRTLVIIPDGPLHALPFAVLVNPETGRYLVETHAIGIAPSLTVFARTAGTAGSGAAHPRVLGVGDPSATEATGSVPLPFARLEAKRLRGIYTDTIVLTERDATRSAFLRHAVEADIIHYAGHATVDVQEPDRSRLQVASEPLNPAGTLFVNELRSAMLRRRPLVVLAACSTNRGTPMIGEGLLSLARPFLEAGARTVIGTLWDIEDRESAELFTRFHSKVATGTPPVLALAEVQRELLRAPPSGVSAPASWAWAVAIGGGAR